MNRFYSSLLAALSLLLLLAIPAWAEDCQSRFAEGWDEPVSAVLVEACEEGFDVSLLEAKAAEGRAKRVSPVKVAAFLAKRLEWYREAKGLLSYLQPPLSPELIAAAGEALGKGLSADALKRYYQTFPQQDPQDALLGLEMSVLFEAQGFPADASFRILEAGFQNGSLNASWQYFPRILPRVRARGLSDEKVADVASQVLKDKGTVRDAMDVLGFTPRNVFEERK